MKLFKAFMISKHCGEINQISHCKKDGKFFKYYPIDINWVSFEKNDATIDNRYFILEIVVGHNTTPQNQFVR